VHTGTEVVTLLRPAVSTTVQAPGRVVRETVTVGRDVVTGTRHAADDVGMGRMTRTTPGTQDLVIDVRDTGTVDRGADGATVAPSAVCGVIAATREAGSTSGAATHAAATAILQAACACSQTMVRAAHGSPGVECQHGDRRLHRPAVPHGVAAARSAPPLCVPPGRVARPGACEDGHSVAAAGVCPRAGAPQMVGSHNACLLLGSASLDLRA